MRAGEAGTGGRVSWGRPAPHFSTSENLTILTLCSAARDWMSALLTSLMEMITWMCETFRTVGFLMN